MVSTLLLVAPASEQAAQASGNPITGTIDPAGVRVAECPATAPALVNGGFEDFTEPNTDYSLRYNTKPDKLWHAYGAGPDMHIFMRPEDLPGWQTTDIMFELQRQVDSYSTANEWNGNFFTTRTYDPSKSGIATAATAAVGTGQFDSYSAQPAEGTYWAELNAFDPSTLYQRVEVPGETRLFWSIKHRGRSSTQEEMLVKIGVPGSATQQIGFEKFAPTNADKFSGYPTYGTSVTSNQIIGSSSDGWNMYAGTLESPAASTPSTAVTMSFEFQSITGGAGYAAVGNLLDDIQFTAFMACPIVKDVYLGQTDTVDVTDTVTTTDVRRHSYGIDQTLSAVANPTGGASAGEFSTTGNSVSFTPTTAGTQTVDYAVSMSLGGTEYTETSRITYNVIAGHQLTLDYEDGTTPDQVSTFTHGALLSAATLPIPTRSGYDFEGWFTAPSGGQLVDSTYAGSTAVTSDLTLYAQWSVFTPPNPPQLTFDFEDGVTPDQVSTPAHGSLLSSVTLPTPSRSGYTFTGWYTAPTGGQLVDSAYAGATSITADLTLYAQWTANQPAPTPTPPVVDPTVRFVFGDGVTADEVVTVGSNTALSEVDLPSPSRSGYRFLGWFTSPSGGQLVDATYASATNVTSNQTLYAQWEIIDPTVTLVFGDAVTPNQVVTIDHGQSLSMVQLPTPVRSGYGFLGWYSAPTGGVLVDPTYASSTVVTSDLVLFGRWDPPIPLVTFEFGDGSSANQFVSVPAGNLLAPSQLPTPSRTGYSFLGWFNSPSAGELVTEAYLSSSPIAGDLTLYAQWELLSIDNQEVPVIDQESQESSSPIATEPDYLADTGFSSSDLFIVSVMLILMGAASIALSRRVRG